MQYLWIHFIQPFLDEFHVNSIASFAVELILMIYFNLHFAVVLPTSSLAQIIEIIRRTDPTITIVKVRYHLLFNLYIIA